ncbi:hydroxymethylglutaryl-CoA synthase [Chlamydiales bacterium]|nr:hydroxymethylglutaryl-CoA synthase [Chlamydiales bacterium]
MDIGIDTIDFYIPKTVLAAEELAQARGASLDKYLNGLGIKKIAILPPDEDIVTMAANAAEGALEGVNKSEIDMLLFATESAVDQSKSAGMWLHQLLGLPSRCRVVELKQACYGATAAIQMASAMVQKNSQSKVLVIASDVSRYELNSPGEPTAGAGAVAMVIAKDPRVLRLEPKTGFYAEDVMDFWRPNYKSEAVVDGKLSIRKYVKVILESFRQYQDQTGLTLKDHSYFGYHIPYPRLAEKTHKMLFFENGIELTSEEVSEQLKTFLELPRLVGNSYTASLYMGLLSLLYNAKEDLSGHRIGLYSYGSGCMGEYFSGVVSSQYKSQIKPDLYKKRIEDRRALTIDEYEAFFRFNYPREMGEFHLPSYNNGVYRLDKIKNHIRLYKKREEPLNRG